MPIEIYFSLVAVNFRAMVLKRSQVNLMQEVRMPLGEVEVVASRLVIGVDEQEASVTALGI